jgi:hypothetical protein
MKRQEKKQPFNWSKVFVVLLCVVIAFAMVATYLSPVVGSMRTIRPNESVTADITIRDLRGNPLVTTSEQVYSSAPFRGFLLRQPMILTAGNKSAEVVNVDAYNEGTGWVRFSLLWLEVDEMNDAIIGMRKGESKSVKFAFENPLMMNVSAEDFESIGGNFTRAQVGDWFPIGFSAAPVEGTGQPQAGNVRLANVLEKTNDTLVITYRYDSVDITIRDIGN